MVLCENLVMEMEGLKKVTRTSLRMTEEVGVVLLIRQKTDVYS